MRQGRCTPRRGSPRTILGPMGCRGIQSSCHFHECFGALVSLDGSGPLGVSLYGPLITNFVEFDCAFIERSNVTRLSALSIRKRHLGFNP